MEGLGPGRWKSWWKGDPGSYSGSRGGSRRRASFQFVTLGEMVGPEGVSAAYQLDPQRTRLASSGSRRLPKLFLPKYDASAGAHGICNLGLASWNDIMMIGWSETPYVMPGRGAGRGKAVHF